MSASFGQRLLVEVDRKGSPCVVGLDPHLDLLPEWVKEEYLDDPVAGIVAYNKLVIDAVADIIPMVKPQSAFYEVFGPAGISALQTTIEYAHEKGLLVLLDAKRGDMGSTSEAYAAAYLDGSQSGMKVDSITVNPYLGKESLEPWCRQAVKNDGGLFIVTLTSNSGSTNLQGMVSDGFPLYIHVAKLVESLQEEYDSTTPYSAIGIVAGATYPDQAALLREYLPKSWFLVPGMGAQGGQAEPIRPLFNKDGMGALPSSSRGIMFPSKAASREQSIQLVRVATETFVSEIEAVRWSGYL